MPKRLVVCCPSGAGTAEAIVPPTEPDDRYPGIVRREASDVAASKWDQACAQAGWRKRRAWAINYISLDDSTAAAGKWDPAQCAANARRAAADPNAVYYVGEFNSGCSEVSIQS